MSEKPLPVEDHNGKPYSPAQLLALQRGELTRLRVMRDAMILAERREQLIETEVVTRQAAAIFTGVRQKLLLIPHTLSHRLVGKETRRFMMPSPPRFTRSLAGDGGLQPEGA